MGGYREEEDQIQGEGDLLMEVAWLSQEVAGEEGNYLHLNPNHVHLAGRPQD